MATEDGTEEVRPASQEAQTSFEMDEFGEDFPTGALDSSITGESGGALRTTEVPETTTADEPAVQVPETQPKAAAEVKDEATTTVEDFGEPVVEDKPTVDPAQETKAPEGEPTTEAATTVVDEAKPVEVKRKTPEELQAEREGYRNQLVDSLVPQFPISDDELASFSDALVEPEARKATLSKLMSRATVHAVELVMQGVATALPELLTTVNKANEEHSKWRTSFFNEFPGLNDAKFAGTIDRVAQSMVVDPARANITPQAFMEELGVTASMILRRPLPKKFLDRMALEQRGEKQAPKPATPTASRAQGAAPGGRVTEEVLNEFADL